MTKVVGIASRFGDGRLQATFVEVTTGDEGVAARELASWSGTRRTSLAEQLDDLRNTIRNRLDEVGADAISVKRVESPAFGRPKTSYDARVALDAIAMLVAHESGLPYFGYRTNEINGRVSAADVAAVAGVPASDHGIEATGAAYAASTDLSDE